MRAEVITAWLRVGGLERENATLKRLPADAELEKVALTEIAKGNC
jgi:putative transposase